MTKRKSKKEKLPVINKATAVKVLEIVDKGLSYGMGKQEPGKMCVEAAVCYAMGEPHTDRPRCVFGPIRDAKININDSSYWADSGGSLNDDAFAKVRKARSKALRRLAIAQLGSQGTITEGQWHDALHDYILSKNPVLKKQKAAQLATAKKDLKEALASLEAGQDIDVAIEYVSPEIDTETDLLVHVKNLTGLKKTCEDLVQILIKLKTPGSKFLYLTE